MVNWPGQGWLLGWLKQRAQRQETATDLYGGVVAQAREAAFYAEMGVPDTLEGRYEMVALHLALVLDGCGSRVRGASHCRARPSRRSSPTWTGRCASWGLAI